VLGLDGQAPRWVTNMLEESAHKAADRDAELLVDASVRPVPERQLRVPGGGADRPVTWAGIGLPRSGAVTHSHFHLEPVSTARETGPWHLGSRAVSRSASGVG
jgi:hypothetical protein